LEVCRQAILQRDFESFAEIMEHDSDLMHAVMMTSRPALFYWEPATLAVMDCPDLARRTAGRLLIDAGPNVRVIAHRKGGEVRES
jgi:diphosphomevalonate decarboxylase